MRACVQLMGVKVNECILLVFLTGLQIPFIIIKWLNFKLENFPCFYRELTISM